MRAEAGWRKRKPSCRRKLRQSEQRRRRKPPSQEGSRGLPSGRPRPIILQPKASDHSHRPAWLLRHSAHCRHASLPFMPASSQQGKASADRAAKPQLPPAEARVSWIACSSRRKPTGFRYPRDGCLHELTCRRFPVSPYSSSVRKSRQVVCDDLSESMRSSPKNSIQPDPR